MTDSARRLADLPRPQQAGILCNDPRFQAFAATRAGAPAPFDTSATAEWLRRQCRVWSRRTLDQPDAARRFDALKTDFDAFTGKIATPR